MPKIRRNLTEKVIRELFLVCTCATLLRERCCPFGNGTWSYVDIYSDILENIMCIKATSDSEAWSAGAIDTVTSFLRPHRALYYFLYRIKVFWVGSICFLSLLMLKFLDFLKLLESDIGTMIGTIIAYLFLLLLITFLSFISFDTAVLENHFVE